MSLAEKFPILLPAFMPQNFDIEAFIETLIKSELETLNDIRILVDIYGKDIPKDIKLLTDRIEYIIKKDLDKSSSLQ